MTAQHAARPSAVDEAMWTQSGAWWGSVARVEQWHSPGGSLDHRTHPGVGPGRPSLSMGDCSALGQTGSRSRQCSSRPNHPAYHRTDMGMAGHGPVRGEPRFPAGHVCVLCMLGMRKRCRQRALAGCGVRLRRTSRWRAAPRSRARDGGTEEDFSGEGACQPGGDISVRMYKWNAFYNLDCVFTIFDYGAVAAAPPSKHLLS